LILGCSQDAKSKNKHLDDSNLKILQEFKSSEFLIYQPSDDSYLLASVLNKYAKSKTVLDMLRTSSNGVSSRAYSRTRTLKDLSVLDIGTGTGILANEAKQAGAKEVTAADINPESKNHLDKLNIPFIKSDLFNNINNSYDLIVFNPPYLPQDKREPKDSQLATTGGKKGDEIILKFLKQAPQHLNKNGIILLLLSSLTPQNKMLKFLDNNGFQHNVIATKKLFMETLFVWEIKVFSN